MAGKAVEFIRDAKVIDPDKPFFMYLAPQAGHAPHLVPLEWADRYKGRFDQGYEAIRSGILERQIALGLLPEGTELSPINPHGEPGRTGPDGQPWPLLDTVRPWETLSDDERRLFARMAEVFAGYISYNDHQLGKVLDYLEASGQLDNTIVVVISDNGASGEGGPNGSFNEWRFFNGVADTTETTLPHIDELGTPRVEQPLQHRLGVGPRHPVPLLEAVGGGGGRRGRHVHRRRGRRASRPSATPRQQYVHAVDVVPTIYELLGIEPPEVLKGYPQRADRGRELRRSALADPAAPGKSTQFYSMLGQRSIYHDGWLASTVHPPLSSWGNFDHDEWELFHLETDRSQSRNVAAEHPERLPSSSGCGSTTPASTRGCPSTTAARLEQVLAERPRRRPGAGPVRLLPRLRRRARVGRTGDPGALVHHRRRRAPRHGRRRGRALRRRRRARRPQPLREGRPASLHVQLDRHGPPGRGRRPGAHRGQPRARRRVLRRRAEWRPVDARHGRGTDAVRRRRCRSPRAGSSPSPGTSASPATASASGATAHRRCRPSTRRPSAFTGGTIDSVVVDLSGDGYVDHEAQVRTWFAID